MLKALCPETPQEALEGLSIGRRDSFLLTMREMLFGSRLEALARCPACGESLELRFKVEDIRVAQEPEPVEELSVEFEGYQVRFNLPDSRDLAAVGGQKDAESGRLLLLGRCILSASEGDSPRRAADLPASVIQAVVERMAQADPQADVHLALTCPRCDHRWSSVFDIASFIWREINAWAFRILREVHALASAYGWREADILAMSPCRRQIYLEMVRQ